MIDYTQLAFEEPAAVVEPVPSVADYLDQYRQRNEDWYASWAYPLGEGRFGARPSSFVRRAPWEEPPPEPAEAPSTVAPPRDLTTPEDRRVRPGDAPIGAIYRDPTQMTSPELWDAYLNGINPTAARVGGGLLTGLLSAGTLGSSFIGGLLAQAGVEQERQMIGNEIGRRMGALNAIRRGESSDPNRIGTRQLGPGGPTVFTSPDLLPSGGDTETGSHQGTGGWSGGYAGGNQSRDVQKDIAF